MEDDADQQDPVRREAICAGSFAAVLSRCVFTQEPAAHNDPTDNTPYLVLKGKRNTQRREGSLQRPTSRNLPRNEVFNNKQSEKICQPKRNGIPNI